MNINPTHDRFSISRLGTTDRTSGDLFMLDTAREKPNEESFVTIEVLIVERAKGTATSAGTLSGKGGLYR